jgi:mRNA-degrading endonuclease RelE of RelBE toxin-antitoxin system
MQLIVGGDAEKGLRAMPDRDRRRLLAKLAEFAADPFAPHPWASPMRGEPDQVRIRQGAWRGVLLIVRARDAVVLERVAHRREVYR